MAQTSGTKAKTGQRRPGAIKSLLTNNPLLSQNLADLNHPATLAMAPRQSEAPPPNSPLPLSTPQRRTQPEKGSRTSGPANQKKINQSPQTEERFAQMEERFAQMEAKSKERFAKCVIWFEEMDSRIQRIERALGLGTFQQKPEGEAVMKNN